MDVTLAMLSKVLEPYLLPGSTLPNSPTVIRTIREQNSDEVSEAEPGILRVINQGGRTALAYQNDPEGAWSLERLVSSAPCAHDMLCLLQDELTTLQDWADRTLRSAFDGDALEQTIQVASEVLDNPIAVFDLSIDTLCFAGLPPDVSTKGTMWETITRLESPFDRCSDDMQRYFIRKLATAQGPVVFRNSAAFNGAFAEDEFMICPVFNGSGLCAFLGSTSIAAPFSARELALVSHLQYVFGGHAAWRQEGQLDALPLPKTVSSLLTGRPVRRSLLNRSLVGYGWRSDEAYRVLRFPVGDGGAGLQVSDAMLRVRSYLPRCILFVWEGDCLCVVREDEFGRGDKGGDLQTLAQKLERCVGASMPFHDLMDLHLAGLQAKEALAAAQADGSLCLKTLESCYGQRVVERITDQTDVRSLCEPHLRAAVDSGALDAEQLATLTAFLECGRNASRAAERLFIHRNTMFYRIERIEAALGISIEDLIAQVGYAPLYLTCLLLDGRGNDRDHS